MNNTWMNAGMVVLTTLLLCTQGVAQTDRMNVLFLVVDDLNSWLLSDPTRYAGRVIAPNINRLADSGVNFARAYCVSTVCTPSRTTLLSGIAPWKSGVYVNGYPAAKSPEIKNSVPLPKLFRNAGYYTAASGKIDHGYRIPKNAYDALFNISTKLEINV